MDARTRTQQELAEKSSQVGTHPVLVGLDGFVDTIVAAVDQRHGQGDRFTPMQKISQFGERVLAAAGKSTNIELFPRLEKLGGNGPIMANAMLSAGYPVRYIGALGKPVVHPVFDEFARKTQAISLSEPGKTTAVEFQDGKIMLGNTTALDEITYETLIHSCGEGTFFDILSRMDLVALVNWTMIPNMTGFLVALLERTFPSLPPRDHRHFFFDLADPEKRAKGDLINALRTMSRFQNHGMVTLGLNLKEGQQVASALSLGEITNDPDSLKNAARRIQQEFKISCVVIHPSDGAACATKEDSFYVTGPYTEKPVITTGAGDHFNAGFMSGRLLGLSPTACLVLGTSFSGYYVRTARSPSLYDIEAFLRENH